MLIDYYESVTKRTYTQVEDGQGGFTKTAVDSTFSGFVADLTGYELVKRQAMNLGATSVLLTDESLDVKDRIVWRTREYEIVYKYDSQFNTYYDLRLV